MKMAQRALEQIAEELTMTDAMTGDNDSYPNTYYVAPENLEYLVQTVLDLSDPYIRNGGYPL